MRYAAIGGGKRLRPLLLTVGLMAASVLPVTSFCVPLLARSNGWTASQAGLVVGATVLMLIAIAHQSLRSHRAPRPDASDEAPRAEVS